MKGLVQRILWWLMVMGVLGHCKSLAVEPVQIPVKGCIEGHSKPSDDGCNTCKCVNGVYACTKKACLDQSIDQGRRCVEGAEWYDDCNWCGCYYGIPLCTRRYCGPVVVGCTVGHSKPSRDGCNTCKCINAVAHGVYNCTKSECPDPTDQDEGCIDGQTKPAGDGCNNCDCYGGYWYCNDLPCHPPKDKRCTEGQSKPSEDGCNTCFCHNGRWGCTEKYCPKAWRDDNKCGLENLAPNGIPAQCDPNGKYPCCSKWGWCGNTGDHCECTGCVDFRDDGCTEGHSKPAEDGCNTCYCHGGRWGCTEIACHPPKADVPKKG